MSRANSPDRDTVSEIAAALGRHIEANGLMVGDKMPSELSLAEKYGVSRTVIREAFRSLAALQMISLSPGKRASVSLSNGEPVARILEHSVRMDAVAIQDVYDVRRTVEARTATLAAIRRTDKEAENIVWHAAQMKSLFHDPAAGMEHDIAFHHAIARASRNKVFEMMITSFEGITRETWPVGWRSRNSDAERMAMVDLHMELASAISERDAIRSAEIMSQHFDVSTRALLSAGIR